jgi:hypothetical protein
VARVEGNILADIRRRCPQFKTTLLASLRFIRDYDDRRYARVQRQIAWVVKWHRGSQGAMAGHQSTSPKGVRMVSEGYPKGLTGRCGGSTGSPTPKSWRQCQVPLGEQSVEVFGWCFDGEGAAGTEHKTPMTGCLHGLQGFHRRLPH